MKRYFLFFLLLTTVTGCYYFAGKTGEPPMMDFTESDIVGAWDIRKAGNAKNSLYPQDYYSDPLNRSYFVFWENGRFESHGFVGFLTEGYWKIDGEGVRVYAGEEPFAVFRPLSFKDGIMTFHFRLYENLPHSISFADNLECTKADIPEFCPGYGSKSVESFFGDESNVKAYLDAVYSDFNSFESLLAAVRVKYNAPVADSVHTSSNYYSPESDYLWKSVNAVLMRANQGIDALTGNASLKRYADNLRGIRAINAFRMVCCWGSCSPYWEHISTDCIFPVPACVTDILDSAARDLASDDVYALNGSGYLDSVTVASARNDIATLRDVVPPSRDASFFNPLFLKKWGFVTDPSYMVLPIPNSVLRVGMALPQTIGWS